LDKALRELRGSEASPVDRTAIARIVQECIKQRENYESRSQADTWSEYAARSQAGGFHGFYAHGASRPGSPRSISGGLSYAGPCQPNLQASVDGALLAVAAPPHVGVPATAQNTPVY